MDGYLFILNQQTLAGVSHSRPTIRIRSIVRKTYHLISNKNLNILQN